jgi:hypothetical protein
MHAVETEDRGETHVGVEQQLRPCARHAASARRATAASASSGQCGWRNWIRRMPRAHARSMPATSASACAGSNVGVMR